MRAKTRIDLLLLSFLILFFCVEDKAFCLDTEVENCTSYSSKISSIKLGQFGTLKLESNSKEGSIAHFDNLFLVSPDGLQKKKVFDSEGRKIIDIQAEDLNNDGKPEVLVTMDPGGSGGYREFALLTCSGNTFEIVWDGEAFKNGRAKFETVNKGREKRIVISHLNIHPANNKKVTIERAVFKFDNGKIIEVTSR